MANGNYAGHTDDGMEYEIIHAYMQLQLIRLKHHTLTIQYKWHRRKDHHENKIIIYKSFCCNYQVAWKKPVLDGIGINLWDVFIMVILIIRKFPRQADLNRGPNHELILKYWVQPFGNERTFTNVLVTQHIEWIAQTLGRKKMVLVTDGSHHPNFTTNMATSAFII